MSKREKRLQKVKSNPKDVSFEELGQLLHDYGFKLRRVTGSHHIFEYTFQGERLKFIVPFGKPIKPYYIKEAIRLIDVSLKAEGDDTNND